MKIHGLVQGLVCDNVLKCNNVPRFLVIVLFSTKSYYGLSKSKLIHDLNTVTLKKVLALLHGIPVLEDKLDIEIYIVLLIVKILFIVI